MTVNERVELLRLILGATLRNDAFVLQSVERLLSPAGKAALAANRAKAEAVVKAINDKGNFSFHACYRLEAILSELQKLGLELPPQINCFIQSMTRMQNMFAETNAMIADLKAGFDALKDYRCPEGTEVDEHDLIGKCLLKMSTPEGRQMVPSVGINGLPRYKKGPGGPNTDEPIYEQAYIVEMRRLCSKKGIKSSYDATNFSGSLKKRIAEAEDKEALVRSLWDKLASYDRINEKEYKDMCNMSISLLKHGSNRNKVIDSVVGYYVDKVYDCLLEMMFQEQKYQNFKPELPASFSQVIMGVVFSGGEAVRDMFDNNFSGVDKVLLGASAKSISREIGGSFFESLETTTNRLVQGAKVLGENDSRNTNVDNIHLAGENGGDDENRIELGV